MRHIKINSSDNVVVALTPFVKGEALELNGRAATVLEDIPAGHKIAAEDIESGADVIKYGYPIGVASKAIKTGERVHVHNVKTKLSGELSYSYEPDLAPRNAQKLYAADTFWGYRREDKSAGIRNEIWIIPTVGCVNSVGKIIEGRAQTLIRGRADGVYSFSHPYGCSQLGHDHENTKKALAGLIKHPNAGGVLVLGLGCENNTISGMKELLGHGDTKRVKFLTCQDFDDETEAALSLIDELLDYTKGFKRTEIPMSELIVGLKCGGSDGLSGITANPLAGMFSDRLTSIGGTTILTEVPEMFGAETILMNRCESREIFDKTVRLINDFKAYFTSHNQPVYENPSPGNKDGGITTLEDKSLGCTQKAGSAVVVDVLKYGEAVQKNGLNLLEAPGNDLVASTALAVSGAHIVLFTTGRGTPFGSPVPTMKISSNSALARKKSNWIDFDAGVMVTGESKENVADSFYETVKAIASGKLKTKTETDGIRDLAIFKTGVTL